MRKLEVVLVSTTPETLTAVKFISHVGTIKLPITAPGDGQASANITQEEARRAGATPTFKVQYIATQSMQGRNTTVCNMIQKYQN